MKHLKISDLLADHDPTETYQNREIKIVRQGGERFLSVSQSSIENYGVQLGKTDHPPGFYGHTDGR